MIHKIDLNCDLGESYGNFKVGQDMEILPYITSANIACGYHAGDHNVINKTIKNAKEMNISIGAHPGFNDIFGFGRRQLFLPPDEIYNIIIYQLGAIDAFCKINKVRLRHVKPHGALYNMSSEDENMANAIVDAVLDFNPELLVYGLSGSIFLEKAEERGLKTVSEVFADRSYMPDGTLAPRNMANSVIKDADNIIKRVIQMVTDNTVIAVNGALIKIKADTICIHGDTPNASLFVKRLREELTKNKIEIKCP